MAMANYLEAGKKFEYTATAAVAYHDVVVINGLVGVASKSAESGETVVCDAEGVFKIAKKSEEKIEQGKKCYLTSDKDVTNTATNNTYIGICWRTAAASDALVAVAINK